MAKNRWIYMRMGKKIKFLTLKVPEKLQLYGLYVYYVVHICDFGMLRVTGLNDGIAIKYIKILGYAERMKSLLKQNI